MTWYGQDSSSPTDDSIFVQQFNANGTTTGHDMVQLEAIGQTTGGDAYPQVRAIGSAGAYVVTWYGADSTGDFSIFVQQFNADGTLAGPVMAQSTEAGAAYLVNTSVTVSDLASITSADGSLWNTVALASANSYSALAQDGLADGVYRVYTVDAAGNLSAAVTGSITIDVTAPVPMS